MWGSIDISQICINFQLQVYHCYLYLLYVTNIKTTMKRIVFTTIKSDSLPVTGGG